MNHFIKFASALLVAGFITTTAQADTFGYCDGTITRDCMFRMGNTEKQGLAIKLDNNKIQLFKGKSITDISAALASKRTTDGNVTVFITPALDADPYVSQVAKIASAGKWNVFALDTPYTITGDEKELYIGYTATISTSSSLLMSDFAADNAGISYAWRDGQWVDMHGLDLGTASVRFTVDDTPKILDMMIKPVKTDGYFKADTPYSLSAQVFNFGNTPVNSFDVSMFTKDGASPAVLHFDNLDIPQNGIYTFNLPELSEHEGYADIDVTIYNVNGTDDSDPMDNSYSNLTFFYPQNMERNILLEGFTGQDCHNCPTGHAIIEDFIKSADTTPVIEIMHHSGYQPDNFTMDADMDYTYFYGSPSTYAPAAMLNRTVVGTVGSAPVFEVTSNNLATVYAALENREPYVSLGIESDYDSSTGKVKVTVTTYAHRDLPADVNILNVALIQNSLVGAQKPYGNNYEHNNVFRGTLTGNSWGIRLNDNAVKAGSKYVWTKEFDLPESIFSDYWKADELSTVEKLLRTIKVVPENMQIVAYVAPYSSTDIKGHAIYNSVITNLGENHIQGPIASAPAIGMEEADFDIRVVGRRIAINGAHDSVALYTIDGKTANPDSALEKGIYVVRITSGTNVAIKKILIK